MKAIGDSMAMTTCRECGKQVSNTAETCPHCGAKLHPAATQTQNKSAEVLVNQAFAIVGGIIFFFAFFTMMSDLDAHSRGYSMYNYSAPLADHEIQIIFLLILGFCLCFTFGLRTIMALLHRHAAPTPKPAASSKDWLQFDVGSSTAASSNSMQDSAIHSAASQEGEKK